MVDENNIQLGPGGGMNKLSMWSKGSGAAQPPQDSPINRPTNTFSALPSDEDRLFQRSPSRGDSGVNNRGLRQGNTAGHGRGKIMGRSSTEGERRDVLASARSIVGGRSQNSSRDNSWNREDRRSMGPRGYREGENSMGPPRTISLRPNAEHTANPSAKPPPAIGGYGAVKKAALKTEDEMEPSAKTILLCSSEGTLRSILR
ncbi:eukaryotic initiation factor 4g [Plakobranchus ocellatus]|uniref:Eukaryotic initiation factor 4g n=1 Tax=Plakobranchus ocellatus TaxID=259542 RepID=A0AAV4D915_9GAST|nr:eukaryotic initiation factor 4g [Plakobranchus ocellatus]